ncbi:MAG: MFS transporter, partial [Myxococcota bacterium]|nr:MFS transporter [Myxococcota bacterium]
MRTPDAKPASASRRAPETSGLPGPVRAPLAMGTKLAYAGPTFALAGMAVPIFVYMGKFYADVVLLPLGSLALAVALARAFDAVTDPVMGWLSDRTRTRLGRRRPWVAAGAPLCGLAFVGLFAPPASLGETGAGIWFGVSFLLFFLFHTVFTIPYNALGPELTLDYHERSSLFGWRESLALVGLISAAVAPAALNGWLDDQRATYATIGAIYGAALVALGLLAAARLRERPEFSTRTSNPFVPGVRRALRNRPFRILLTSYVVGSITAAIPGTLLPFFISYVVRPERELFWTTAGIAGHFVAALASIPVWVALARRTGKRPAWLAAYAMSLLSLGAAFGVGEGDVAFGMAVFAWAGVAFGGQLFLTPSIQADVIDYDELLTGKRREAQYGALWALFPKLVAIPGAAIPFAVLGSMGYRPNVAQTPEVVLAIRVLLALVPAAFAAAAFVVAWRFPIDEAMHREIQEGIDRHARGEWARDPLTGRMLPPPGLRSVDEEAAWRLDHFSPRELARAAHEGPARLRGDTRRALAVAVACLVAAVAVAAFALAGSRGEPGALAVVSIASAGLALSAVVFHALRVRAARRLDAEALPPDTIALHLEALRTPVALGSAVEAL